MSDTVIRVENLCKKYIIGHQKQEHYTALRDVLADGAKSFGQQILKPFGKRILDPAVEEFWALKDVSFEIKQGDRVGIIGRNGAGKSTLLKVLSRITEPTTGRISIKGRVASLLEVGTGFHPELTGRENIYLNGAILGMSKAEIKKKFNEIVAFAEVEKFLDTPVKRYSSGMYVRLAFAVAAHLEPEILIVDEVLAVGDAAFQKKCLGKMEDVSKEGRTILFVSHNMGAIKALCNCGIVMSSGLLIYTGSISASLNYYNTQRNTLISNVYISNSHQTSPFVKKIEIQQEGAYDTIFQMHRPIKIYCELENNGAKDLVVSIVIRNAQGDWLVHTSDEFSKHLYNSSSQRECVIPPNTLSEGNYYVIVALGSRPQTLYEKLDDVISFAVEFSGKMADKMPGNTWKGLLSPGIAQWN